MAYPQAGTSWAAPPTTMAAPASSGGLVVRTRMLDGILTGVAAAGIGGAIWWALATFTDLDQWHFFALVVGVVVGQGVLVGTRRGGAGPAILAFACSCLAVLVAVYFIDRSLYVGALEDAGRSTTVPLWQGFGSAKDAVWNWVDFDPSKAAGWLLAPVAAVIITVFPKARPLVG